MEYYAATEKSVIKEDFVKQRQVYDRGFKKRRQVKIQCTNRTTIHRTPISFKNNEDWEISTETCLDGKTIMKCWLFVYYLSWSVYIF